VNLILITVLSAHANLILNRLRYNMNLTGDLAGVKSSKMRNTTRVTSVVAHITIAWVIFLSIFAKRPLPYFCHKLFSANSLLAIVIHWNAQQMVIGARARVTGCP